jgi:arabinose-5-phosphate isomerase
VDERFAQAVQMMLACRGRVVVMGMGKSGHVGRKIAATLASTGTPALFVHPAEASHGDLGMVTGDDVVLAISNSGESDELTAILPVLKRLGAPLIAMTGGRTPRWPPCRRGAARQQRRAGSLPAQPGPTASTTAQLALGDALAVALLDARGFRRRGLCPLAPRRRAGPQAADPCERRDAQRRRRARACPDASFSDLMREMSAKGLGCLRRRRRRGRRCWASSPTATCAG